jgi:hypothetical protein
VIRQDVQSLLEKGPLPAEDAASEEELEDIERILKNVPEPLSDEEAHALVSIFGPDGCFGLAWFVVHLIETAPGASSARYSENEENEWVKMLHERVLMANQRNL